MPDSTQNVYWDSCVFISLIEKTPGRVDCCAAIYDNAKEGNIKIITSTVTPPEVNHVKDSDGKKDVAKSKKLLDFFENDYVVLRQVDRRVSILAHEIARDNTGPIIKPMDALQLATAVTLNNDGLICEMHTYDGAGDRKGGLLQLSGKYGNPPLKICMPPEPPKTLLSFIDKPSGVEEEAQVETSSPESASDSKTA